MYMYIIHCMFHSRRFCNACFIRSSTGNFIRTHSYVTLVIVAILYWWTLLSFDMISFALKRGKGLRGCKRCRIPNSHYTLTANGNWRFPLLIICVFGFGAIVPGDSCFRSSSDSIELLKKAKLVLKTNLIFNFILIRFWIQNVDSLGVKI